MRREETVDFNIRATWQAIARMYNQQAARYGATMSTGFVLLNINSEEGTPATKIAPLMGLEARSLTRILKSLEEAKMIYRETDKSDKRLVRIFLTKEGKVKKEKAREVVLLFNEKIREEIVPEKLNIFFDVLTDINKIIDQNNMFDNLAV
jgi:DNA-binding MarR family transcriptional regulator